MLFKNIIRQKEKVRIILMVILLAICCILTYYFHVILKQEVVFTHFFYIPIILAGIWWKRKGLIVAGFLGAFLILEDYFLHSHFISNSDYARVAMFIIIGIIAVLLGENIAKGEEKLRESKEFIENIAQGIRDRISLLSKDLKVLWTNNAMLDKTGYNSENVLGKYCYQVTHGKDSPCQPPNHICPTSEVLKTGKSVTVVHNHFDEAGNKSFLEISSFPIKNESGEIIRFIHLSRDITYIKQIEEELRTHRDYLEKLVGARTREILNYQKKLQKLVTELSLTAQRERKKIAAELHNQIGQTLYASKMKLSALRESLTTPDTIKQTEEVLNLTNIMIKDARLLMFNIGTPLLYEVGFKAAFEWLVEQFQKQFDIKFIYEFNRNIENIKEEIVVMLYQTVRELLTNANKHSKAKNVKIKVTDDDKDLVIQVEDDGIGFEYSKNNHDFRDGGFGLFNIQEQLNSYGGSFDVVSGIGKGTLIKISLPRTKM